MTTLAFLCLVALAGDPRGATARGRVHDLAGLTPRDAYALQGRLALFLVKLDSGVEYRLERAARLP
jgi:hypothetical protein